MLKTLTAAALAGAAIATATATATPAQAAAVGEGCVSDFWMWNGLRSAERLICDGERQADGSWMRVRGFFDDAFTPNGHSSCSRYSCTYYPPRYVPQLKVIDRYVVTDATVLGDEPGWIPSAEPRIVT